MTRLTCLKYPSDMRNYHAIRRPDYAHTIRLPEELLPTYVSLKRAIGPKSTHADVVRFLFDAVESPIEAALQAHELRAVVHPVEECTVDEGDPLDPDDDVGEVVEDSEDSDQEMADEAGALLASENDVVNNLVAPDSQVPQSSGPAT
ncbi:hypothetical protein R1flu_006751 [Riccia fluitans]|uniref:Uncharacterized protein n=1 Tax=Riccia fluitans TaxID=41844 RepID=A0ABD1Z0Z7_9MARC